MLVRHTRLRIRKMAKKYIQITTCIAANFWKGKYKFLER